MWRALASLIESSTHRVKHFDALTLPFRLVLIPLKQCSGWSQRLVSHVQGRGGVQAALFLSLLAHAAYGGLRRVRCGGKVKEGTKLCLSCIVRMPRVSIAKPLKEIPRLIRCMQGQEEFGT